MSDLTSEHQDYVMDIEIDTLMGTSFDMTVSSTDTVRKIKMRIHRVQGIPVSQQNLIYQSEELKDSHRLCDAGVSNGATLQLITSIRGGPISTRRAMYLDHQALFKELRDLVDCTREVVEEKKKIKVGSKVSVLVFKEGEVLHLLSVIENQDGTYSPYTGKAVAPPIKPRMGQEVIIDYDNEDYVPLAKSAEHLDMRDKVHILRNKMKHSENKKLARASSKIAFPDIMSKEELLAHFSYRKPSEKCSFELENEEVALKDKHRIKSSVSSDERSAEAKPEIYQPKHQPYSLPETEPVDSTNSIYAENLLPGYETDSEPFSLSPLKNLHIRSGIGIRSRGHGWDIRRYDDEKPVEVCAGELCHGQYVRSPSAIPPQYAPKDEGLCNYYYKNRAPLYRRQCLDYEQKSQEADREGDMYRICEKYPEVEKNFLDCSSPIRKLSDEGFGNDGDDGGIADLPRKISAFNFYDLYSNYCCDLDYSPPAKTIAQKNKEKEDATLVKISSEQVLPPVVAKKKSRCNECNKRLNITNIYHCRCGKIFCSQHRYSEVHRCDYDYKMEGRKILEMQNPMVKADKITRI